MDTRTAEITDGIYRLSTFVPEIAPPAGFTFNQFLVLGDEPLLFHTGLRRMFPLVRDALARIIPPEQLRWIAFGHYEADECGAMNEWLRSEITAGFSRPPPSGPEFAPPAGFTFNQFLVLGDEPLLFHTGLRRMFPLVRDALARIIPPEQLRWIAFGHYEADECGAMNEWL